MVEMNVVARSEVSARGLGPALLASVPLTGLLEAVYYYGGVEGVRDETPLRAAAVGTAGVALTALLLWLACRGAYARADGGQLATRSVWLGVLAALSFLGFWIGVFGPVCVAAVLFGRAAISAGRARAGWLAVGLGGLVAVAGTVVCLLGAS